MLISFFCGSVVEFLLQSAQSGVHGLLFKVFPFLGELQLSSSGKRCPLQLISVFYFPSNADSHSLYTRELYVSQQPFEMQQDRDWNVLLIDVGFFCSFVFPPNKQGRRSVYGKHFGERFSTVIFELKTILEFKNTVRGICKFLLPQDSFICDPWQAETF